MKWTLSDGFQPFKRPPVRFISAKHVRDCETDIIALKYCKKVDCCSYKLCLKRTKAEDAV